MEWSKPGQLSMSVRTLLNGEVKLWGKASTTYGNSDMKMTLGYETKTMGLTVFSKEDRDLTFGVQATFTVAQYDMVYRAGVRMEGDRRIIGCSMRVLSNGVQKINLYKNTIIVWTTNTKSMEQQFGVM